MSHSTAPKQPCRQELVVCRKQRRRVVQHGYAARRQRTEHPQSVVDTVERRQHVEATERNIAGPELFERLLGRPGLPSTPEETAAARASFV
jgi:hypothetical protein